MTLPIPTPRSSLSRHLMSGLALAIVLLWLAAAGIAGVIVRHEIDEVFDSALQEVVQRILPLAYSEILTRDADDAAEQELPDVSSHEEYITYVVRDAKGRVLLKSHAAEISRFPADLKPGFEDRSDGRFYTESAVKGSLIVNAAEKLGHRNAALRKAILGLVLPLALVLPLIMIITAWLVRRSIRPVAELGVAIVARGDGNLLPVNSVNLPAEILPVGTAVNTLLGRLRRALEAERSFTANSAHELRTPVAGALAQVQRLKSEVKAPGAQSRLSDVEKALNRLTRLTEKLLQLSKADGGALLSDQPQDLRTVMPHILADFGNHNRLILSIPDGPVLSKIDIDVFAVAARNLIENALRHGAEGAPVRITLEISGMLRVANRGAILSEETFQRLRQRFARGGSSEEGFGLGLAIIDAIARGTGVSFDMISPAPDLPDGVEMRLTFPLF